MFIITDQKTLRIGRKRGLAGAGQTEEDGRILAVLVGIGRAVHGGDAAQRIEVVHNREHALLHFAAVPGVQNDLFVRREVKDNSGFAIKAEFLVVFDLGLGGVIHDEVGLAEVREFFFRRTDEHVAHEVSLPGHFHDETHLQTCRFVGAAERIDNEKTLVGQLLNGQVLNGIPCRFAHGLVVVLVRVARPPNGVLGGVVLDEELIFRGATRVNARHDVDGAEIGHAADFIALKTGFGLFGKKCVVVRVVDNLRVTGDSILGQVNFCHSFSTG